MQLNNADKTDPLKILSKLAVGNMFHTSSHTVSFEMTSVSGRFNQKQLPRKGMMSCF